MTHDDLTKLCKKVAKLTDNDEHTKARLTIAKAFPSLRRDYVVVLRGVLRIQEELGYLNQWFWPLRKCIDDDMFDALRTIDPAARDRLWKCL